MKNRYAYTLVCLLFFPYYINASEMTVPAFDPEWEVTKKWETDENIYLFEARSTSIVDHCRNNPTHYLVFPFVQQVSQTVLLDNATFLTYGAADMSSLRSYYGSPIVACGLLSDGHELVWRVYSLAKTFARIRSFPVIDETPPWNNLFNETFNVIVAGSLPFIAVVFFILFNGKINRWQNICLSLSCIFHAIFFITTVTEFFNIRQPILSLQKIGDISLWIGVLLFINCLRISGLISGLLFTIYALIVGVSCVVIGVSNNLDAAQIGTAIPFLASMIILISALYHVIKEVKVHGVDLFSLCLIASLGLYVSTAIHDILSVEGYINSSYMFYSVGVLAAILFYALNVHVQIVQTYNERDHLRNNLEDEVKRKTTQLETALAERKSFQAELVQSAKLASLGTLTAGIAHEINNAINFVNGSIIPLRKILADSASTTLREKTDPLLHAISHGTKLTIDIIKNLRDHTGTKQAVAKPTPVLPIVTGILTILRDKMRKNSVSTEVDIADNLTVYTNPVALNQMLLNIIVNAIDAMATGGQLTIHSESNDDAFQINIIDNGMGMDEDTLVRVFDPFFTTKDVGQGTGLGLHIVRNEVQKLGGSISIDSTLHYGSTVTLQLPNLRTKNGQENG